MNRLQQPAATAVCALLGELLDTAAQCAARLENSEDSAALHDFRVALRRLRANQRAYRDQIGAKQDKRLRRLTHATNAARDREVQLDWLRLQRQEAKSNAQGELDTLIEKLENEQAAESRDSAYWQAEFAVLAKRMRRRLKKISRPAESPESFAGVAGAQLRELRDKLRQGIAAIETQGDDASVHATRIIGKRLRYLAEPIAGAVPGTPLLIRRLKALQDLLGEIHDCQVRLDDFAGRNAKHSVDRYAALRHHTAARRVKLLADLRAHWLGEHAKALLQPLQRVIDRLKSSLH